MTKSDTRLTEDAANLIAGECLAVRVRLLNRTITAIYDDALRPLGLTVGQLNILVVVAKLGPLSPGDVARRLNMEKSTVSRNVGLMRKNGWLAVTGAESARRQDLELTRQGDTLLAKALAPWEEAQTQAKAVLGRGGAESIHSVANAVWSRVGRS